MQDVILSIDQGTTGSTALLLGKNVSVVSSCNVEFPNHYPKPGWVEHDVSEIWESVRLAVQGALAKSGPVRIVGIGITNQRETSLFWDKNTGEPIHRALVWQDRRTAERCRELKESGHSDQVKQKTGLVLDPYFSGTKAEWLLENVPGARVRAERGEIIFGTIDTWLIWKLCGAHVTDPSNASRTLLFNINSMSWDPEMLALLNIPSECLPEVVDNSGVVGHTKGVGFLDDGIPVSGMAGDQQAALFGQACFQAGMAKCTYGTGAFVLMNTGENVVYSNHGLLTTVAWRVGGEACYALEGSAFIAGAAVQWLRDNLQIISSSAEVERLAQSVSDNGGVRFVPAFAGLGAPHWDPSARGLFHGITGGTERGHLARAVLEGVAMQIVDILSAMNADSSSPLVQLRVDGGMARNNLLMQFQSDVLNVPCLRPSVLETTALGSAFLAGLGVGFWSDTTAISEAWRLENLFEPNLTAEAREIHLQQWVNAVSKA
jgi:glycerol kinase